MTLTPNQEKSLKGKSKAEHQKMRADYEKRNAAQKRKQNAPKATQTSPARQGRKKQSIPRNLGGAMNAFNKVHMPCKGTTGAYAVTNLITPIEFETQWDVDQVIVVGQRFLWHTDKYLGPATDIIAYRYDAKVHMDAIDFLTEGEVRSPIVGAPDFAATSVHTGVRARLHNMSARIQCLGTSGGLVPPGDIYMGCVPSLEVGTYSIAHDQHQTLKKAWVDSAIANYFITGSTAASLVKPRTVTAPIAESVAHETWEPITLPNNASSSSRAGLSLNTGLEPILIYVPRTGTSAIDVKYRLTIACEWCSRHPDDIMMRATQKQHKATPTGLWEEAQAAVRSGLDFLAPAVSGALEGAAGAAAGRAAASILG